MHDDQLMLAIDRVTRRAGATPRDLARVAVSAGPGGFTAVRIAVMAAKIIAEATGADCVPIPTAMIVARRRPVLPAGPFAVALASKGATTYAATFDDRGEVLGPGRLITAEDLPTLRIRLLIADRFLPEAIRVAAVGMGIDICAPVFDPVACLEIGRAATGVDPAYALPIYPREPEAVTKWRALHG
jgi:tRNA threonylcarbamoyladenosine biosynthesis protein TsaB